MPTEDDKTQQGDVAQPSDAPIDAAPPAITTAAIAAEPVEPAAAAAPPPTTNPAPAEDKNPNKKRKIALFLSYVGHGYQGMQRNPGAKSIEEDLFKAIAEAGGISEANSDEEGFKKVCS